MVLQVVRSWNQTKLNCLNEEKSALSRETILIRCREYQLIYHLQLTSALERLKYGWLDLECVIATKLIKALASSPETIFI